MGSGSTCSSSPTSSTCSSSPPIAYKMNNHNNRNCNHPSKLLVVVVLLAATSIPNAYAASNAAATHHSLRACPQTSVTSVRAVSHRKGGLPSVLPRMLVGRMTGASGQVVSSALRRSVKVHSDRLKLPRWDGPGGVCEYLNENNVKSSTPLEVSKMMRRGWVLVDVRRLDQFEESHAEGSVNVELFQLLPFGGSPRNALKFLLTSSQGATPVDPNPEFVDQVKQILSQRGVKGVILADAEGGCLDDAEGQLGPYGASSRSLVAAYKLLSEGGVGSNKIGHLQYGLNYWFNEDLPMGGKFQWTPEARTPTGGLGNSKFSANRRKELDDLPQWRRYLDAFGGLSMMEQAKKSAEKIPLDSKDE
mmetsp:Transcript_14445/g.25977  ORF Transcript_14445/g.25977 Transcript_14445/m.25977 type:complete len:361 (+) Transcript_14445:3-1085(+)